MEATILYGTESGNAEMVADDLLLVLKENFDAVTGDMGAFDVRRLAASVFYVFVCSTYGEGALPLGAQEFHDKLVVLMPDLTGVRYAMFGMGDSRYPETYNNGSRTLDALLISLGAERVGTHGFHDAASLEDPTETATRWFEEVLAAIHQ